MKTKLLLIMLFLAAFVGHSQVSHIDPDTDKPTLKDGRYIFKQSVNFIEEPPQEDSPYIYSFTIIKSTTVIISKSDDNYIYFKKEPETFNETFAVKKEDFFYYTEQQFDRFKNVEVGLYTIPFRIRGGGDDLDFETNLSLQANIVFGFGKRKSQVSWFDASVGIGLSSIALNEKNSKVTENRTASALTLSIGGVVKPTSRANIGLFLGGDFLGRNDRNVDWKYDKNLWLGVGINISLNKIETNTPATTTSSSTENDLEDNLKKSKLTAEKKLTALSNEYNIAKAAFTKANGDLASVAIDDAQAKTNAQDEYNKTQEIYNKVKIKKEKAQSDLEFIKSEFERLGIELEESEQQQQQK